MLSRILFGCTAILLALFLTPQSVEAGASGDERLRPREVFDGRRGVAESHLDLSIAYCRAGFLRSDLPIRFSTSVLVGFKRGGCLAGSLRDGSHPTPES